MRTIRRIATIAATAAALAIGPVATAQAASPEIVDPAGDARNSFNVNIDEVDIRAVDVASNGTTLTYTIQVGDFPALQNRTYVYDVALTLPGGVVLHAAATNANPPLSRLEFRDALLSVGGFGEDDFQYAVPGTSSVDRTTDTVTLSFPVAAVEAESAARGIEVIGAAVSASRADSSSSTNFRVVATDTASGGAFTLGG
ncbi:hypothetical protein [Pseudonocardia hydrocarbonoxydans]|uniref:Uncharacterized protein n=1 Tax=Pseudonocardia hydrocarbonoxydans TaxID=76726 RepID=A0A4Y3WH16_9PSEU|nr:hypothetical protein [Pseudonocardia hydrocarbonoxydans]GEC18292.1 hypothetical protein PHY01_05750 [Pseudonocardia hydrocarbonoxydans]